MAIFGHAPEIASCRDEFKETVPPYCLRLTADSMQGGDPGGKNKENWGDLSRIKRNFSEKMLSSHHYFEIWQRRGAGVVVIGWDAFFNAPTRPYAGFEVFKNPDTGLLRQFLAVVARN